MSEEQTPEKSNPIPNMPEHHAPPVTHDAVPENFGITDYKEIPIDQIEMADWNPNEQDDKTFNNLVDSIKREGFVQAIGVVPTGNEEKPYRVIDGNHRYKACKVLGWKKIPANILKEYGEDVQKLLTVRLNVMRGKINGAKLHKLAGDFAKHYGQEELAKLLGYNDPKPIEAIYKAMTKNLPEELRTKLAESKKEVKTIDDLSRVLNDLFQNYGATVPHNFMYFTWGGKRHVMIQSSKDVFESISNLLKVANQKNVDCNIAFQNLLKDWDKKTDDIFAER